MAGNFLIRLDPDERGALYGLAGRELRDVRAQALILIREGLLQRGLLPQNDNADGRNPSAFVASQAGAGDATASIAQDAPEGGQRATR